MTEQEQPADQPSESAPEAASTPSAVEVALDRINEAQFQRMVSADLEREGITQAEDRANLERFYLSEADSMRAADPAAGKNPNTYAIAYVSAKEKFRTWQKASARWTAVHGTDAEFQAYETKVEAARHEKDRERIRDRALEIEKRVMDHHEQVKKTDGRSTWELSDEEFKARVARDEALSRATIIERGRLSDDELRMRVRAERARREVK